MQNLKNVWHSFCTGKNILDPENGPIDPNDPRICKKKGHLTRNCANSTRTLTLNNPNQNDPNDLANSSSLFVYLRLVNTEQQRVECSHVEDEHSFSSFIVG